MKYRIKEYPELKEKTEQMTLHQLMETLICPAIMTQKRDPLQHPTVGVLLHPAPEETLSQYMKKVRKTEEEPHIFCADLESGAGNVAFGTTRFPSFMACKAAGGAAYAYKMGQVCAREALKVGYNWTLAPCVDIVMNHDSPVASLRAASETAEEVIEIAGAYMKGLQENGIAATLKHFPGDGLCEYDQHLTTPENPLSMEEWYASYGKVYAALIKDGAKAIMPGHISLPAYDEKDEYTGVYPPATLSRRLITDLLKKELGFEGIVVSDGASMGGFSGFMNYYDACVSFWAAGGDVLLFADLTPQLEEHVAGAVKEGKISMETLRNRAYRVLCFVRELEENRAAELEKYDQKISEQSEDKLGDFGAETAREITKRACTIVRDRGKRLPFDIQKETKILHAVVTNNCSGSDIEKLSEALKSISDHVEVQVDPGCGFLRKAAEEKVYDLIVCTVGCCAEYGINAIKLHGPIARNMMNGWTKFDTPVVFVNLGHPWFGDEYKASVDTLINTYGCSDYTAEAVLEKITGGDKKWEKF